MSDPTNPTPALEFLDGKVHYKGQSFNLLVGIMLLPGELNLDKATALPGYVVVPNGLATPIVIETGLEEVKEAFNLDEKVLTSLEFLHQAKLNAQAEREALVATPLPNDLALNIDIGEKTPRTVQPISNDCFEQARELLGIQTTDDLVEPPIVASQASL